VLFALHPDEPLPQETLRVLLGQLDGAVNHLASVEGEPGETVHEVRKAIKRVRTTLRLLRQALGKRAFSEENAALSAIADKLSAARDAQMLVEVTERLAKHAEGSPYAEAVAPIHAALVERCPKQPIGEETLRQVVSGLQEVGHRLEARLIDVTPSKIRQSMARGVERMMARGKKACELAYAEPSEENFHAWRKRIKDLYYTACLVHLSRPTKLAPLVDTLDRMSEELGDEHDLSVLGTVLHDDPQHNGGAVAVALLLQLIARRREELRQQLRPIGRELHMCAPRKMARRLVRGLKT
jgi:CHAD domain-containing protein